MQRRTFVKNSTLTTISVSAFGALNWNGKNFEGDTPHCNNKINNARFTI
jgi:catechol 1,2-dioxygenase